MKLILKWLVICLLLLVAIQIFVYLVPASLEVKQSISFLLGVIDGSICMNCYLYERKEDDFE